MAAGVTFKPKRKAGAFVGGDLATGEVGLDTTNDIWYHSTDGSSVTVIGSSSGLNAGSESELTISSGAITVTGNHHDVGGEGNADDDLVTISGGTTGDMLFLRSSGANAITVLSTGNIRLLTDGGAGNNSTRELGTGTSETLFLLYDGSEWREVGNGSWFQAGIKNSHNVDAGVLTLYTPDPFIDIIGEGAMDDDLLQIDSEPEGKIIFLTSVTNTTTVKHNSAGGDGDIYLASGADFDLFAPNGPTLMLISDGTDWYEIGTNSLRTDGTANSTGWQRFNGIAFPLTPPTIDISSGNLLPTVSHFLVDTESAAATDDLVSFSQVEGAKAGLVFFRAAHDDRTVVVKHGTSANNFRIPGGQDITLDDTNTTVMAIFDSEASPANWFVIGTYGSSGGFNAGAETTIELVADELTPTGNHHKVAAQSGTADDLDTITAGTTGDLLIIRPDTGDTITIIHDTGNIITASGADTVMVGTSPSMFLVYDGTDWREVSNVGGETITDYQHWDTTFTDFVGDASTDLDSIETANLSVGHMQVMDIPYSASSPFRGLHSYELTSKVALTDTISSINTSTETITTTAPHGLLVGQPIRFTTTDTLPDPLAVNTIYYVHTVTSTTFRVATAKSLADSATSINLTDSGTGTHTIWTLNHPLEIIPTDHDISTNQKVWTLREQGDLMVLEYNYFDGQSLSTGEQYMCYASCDWRTERMFVSCLKDSSQVAPGPTVHIEVNNTVSNSLSLEIEPAAGDAQYGVLDHHTDFDDVLHHVSAGDLLEFEITDVGGGSTGVTFDTITVTIFVRPLQIAALL